MRDRVRTRAMVTTKPVEGMAKLRQQIAQLMAALTQIRWGNGHTSTTSSSWECGHRHGCSGGGNHSCLDSHNDRVGPGQMTETHSLPMECGVEGMRSCGGEQGTEASV